MAVQRLVVIQWRYGELTHKFFQYLLQIVTGARKQSNKIRENNTLLVLFIILILLLK